MTIIEIKEVIGKILENASKQQETDHNLQNPEKRSNIKTGYRKKATIDNLNHESQG